MCSRRDADIYIAAGNVTVNGKVVTEMGYKVQLNDEVKFDGRRINPEKPEYVLLNKPKGFFVTGSLEKKNRTVMDLVANASKAKLDPVGKLDTQATGLLLFTNDGQMAKKPGESQRTDSGRSIIWNWTKIWLMTIFKRLRKELLSKMELSR